MYIGVDIGGTHFSVGVVNDDNTILDKKYVVIEKEQTANQVIYCLCDIINVFMQKYVVDGIGIGIPGVCNLDNMEIHVDDKHIWKNVDIIKLMQDNIDLPIFFDNDANCATMAEYSSGSLKLIDNCMLVTVGTGIGAGIIIGGKIYHGTNYTAGEIGHIVFEKNGRICSCGNKGCFEQYGSMKALKKEFSDNGINDFEEGFNSNDAVIKGIIDNWLDVLSDVFSNVANILDVDTIAIGGGAAEYYDKFGDKLQMLVNQKIFNKERYIYIKKARYSNDAGIIGASILCRKER